MRLFTTLATTASVLLASSGVLAEKWQDKGCTLIVNYQNPNENASAKESKASFVIRTPSFKMFALTNLDGDSVDVESKYLTKGKLHANKGATLKDFYFTYDGQKIEAPLTPTHDPDFGLSSCMSEPNGFLQCELLFNCTGTNDLLKHYKDGKVFERRAYHLHV